MKHTLITTFFLAMAGSCLCMAAEPAAKPSEATEALVKAAQALGRDRNADVEAVSNAFAQASTTSAGVAAATGATSGVQSMPAAHSCDSAIRQGLRTATSPPGSGTARRWPTRWKRWASAPIARISPPQIVSSVP